MRISRVTRILALLACACGEPVACPGELLAVDGGRFCVVPLDASLPADAGAADRCPDLLGIQDRIEVRTDGSGMAAMAEAALSQTTWSDGGEQLIQRDGWLWWAESNDQCGVQDDTTWYGFNTVRFRDDGTGRVLDTAHACEPGTYPLIRATAALSTTETLLVCGEGHHPSRFLLCGAIREGPGSFVETVFLDRPRKFRLGRRADGFVLLHFNLDTGERALEILDGQGRPEHRVGLSAEPGAFREQWVEAVGEEIWIGRSGDGAGAPAEVERVAVDSVLRPVSERPLPIALDGFPSSSTLTPLAGPVSRSGGVTFLLREETPDASRMHLAVVRADRSFGTRLIDVGSRRARIVPWEGGFLIAVERTGTELDPPTVELLRVDCGGRLLEPPLALASRPGLRVRALAARSDDPLAWVVVSAEVEPHVFDHSVITVRLP